MKYQVTAGQVVRAIDVLRNGDGSFQVRLENGTASIGAVAIASGVYSILIDGRVFDARVSSDGSEEGLLVRCAGVDFRVRVRDPRSWRARRHGVLEAAGPQRVLAPMPGKIVRVLVSAGDEVEIGRGLVVVEAMKMQNEIRAPKSGRIQRVLVAEGQAVRTQETLMIVS